MECRPENSKEIARQVATFIGAQKFENESRFDKVLPTLKQVVESSELITVILISDGQNPIKGTPFDEQVNTMYTTWKSDQAKARMPFLTALRGVNRQFTAFTVNVAPWPIEFPPLPAAPEPSASADATPTGTAPAEPKPRATGPSLILSGRDTASPTPPAPQPPPVETATAADPAPTPAPPPTPVEATVPTPPTRPPAVDVSASAPAPAPAPVKLSPPPTAQVAIATTTPPPRRSQPVAPEPAPVAATGPTSLEAAGVDPSAAVAVPPRTFDTRWMLVLVLSTAVVVLCVVILLLLRRSRPSTRASLITRSLDRENE